MDEKEWKTSHNPYSKANLLSKLTFRLILLNLVSIKINIKIIHLYFISWLNSLVKIGYKNPLGIDDLYTPLHDHQAEYNTNLLEKFKNLNFFLK